MFRGYHFRSPVELVDVVPTVLDLLGVEKQEGETRPGSHSGSSGSSGSGSGSSSSRRGEQKGKVLCLTRAEYQQQQQQQQQGSTPFFAAFHPLCRPLDGKSLAALFTQPAPPHNLSLGWQHVWRWLTGLWSDPEEETLPLKFIPLALERKMKRSYALSQKQLCANKRKWHSFKVQQRIPLLGTAKRLPNPWRGCSEFSSSDSNTAKDQVRCVYDFLLV